MYSVINSDSALKSGFYHLCLPLCILFLLLFLLVLSIRLKYPCIFHVTSLSFTCQSPWHFFMSPHGPMWLDWASSHHGFFRASNFLSGIWLPKGRFPDCEGERYRNLKDYLCKNKQCLFYYISIGQNKLQGGHSLFLIQSRKFSWERFLFGHGIPKT